MWLQIQGWPVQIDWWSLGFLQWFRAPICCVEVCICRNKFGVKASHETTCHGPWLMCRVMVKAGKTAVRVIGSFGPLGERLYRWMTAVGQTKRSDWRMNGSATTWIFTYKNIGRPTLAHVRNSIRAYILLWYENCSAIQVSSEESHRYDIELKLCLRKLNILTKRFDTWRWPVIIWTVGEKWHVQWILSKKLYNHVQSHFNSNRICLRWFSSSTMLHLRYQVNSAEFASCTWNILNHPVVGNFTLNQYIFGNDKTYYHISIWTHDCWLFWLVFSAHCKNISHREHHFSIWSQIEKIEQIFVHIIGFLITSCGRPNFTPAAAVPAKATRDPDAILRQNWWIHWIKGKKTRNPCKKKHQF
jgi:hypothetical protein